MARYANASSAGRAWFAANPLPAPPLDQTPGRYVREYYQVPAVIGMRVIVDRRPGVIVGFAGSDLLAQLDDTPGIDVPCHPTWRVTYLDPEGKELLKTGG